jgi:Flp pilus assembly protein TadG
MITPRPARPTLGVGVLRDERGAAYAETLVTLPLILVLFLALYQYVYVCAADLIMERAAAAAVRAAIVFLPDSPLYYDDPSPETRQQLVAQAARLVLMASKNFDTSSVRVNLSGDRSAAFGPMKASVEALYDCSVFLVEGFCGADRKVLLRAEATLPHQRDNP